MAVAFVQAKASTEGLNVASLATTFDSDTTNANLIHVSTAIWDSDSTPPTGYTISDNKSNTYNSCNVGQTLGDAGTGGIGRLEAHRAENISGGASHEVTSSPGDTVFMTVGLIELSGAATSGALGNVNSGIGEGTAVASGSVNPDRDGLFVGAMQYDRSTSTTMSPALGLTQRLEIDENFEAAPHNIVTAPATSGNSLTAEWTLGGSGDWAAYLVHYREPAAAVVIPRDLAHTPHHQTIMAM